MEFTLILFYSDNLQLFREINVSISHAGTSVIKRITIKNKRMQDLTTDFNFRGFVSFQLHFIRRFAIAHNGSFTSRSIETKVLIFEFHSHSWNWHIFAYFLQQQKQLKGPNNLRTIWVLDQFWCHFFPLYSFAILFPDLISTHKPGI